MEFRTPPKKKGGKKEEAPDLHHTHKKKGRGKKRTRKITSRNGKQTLQITRCRELSLHDDEKTAAELTLREDGEVTWIKLCTLSVSRPALHHLLLPPLLLQAWKSIAPRQALLPPYTGQPLRGTFCIKVRAWTWAQ